MGALRPTLPPAIDLDHVVANSFRDFHIKGFDYICVRRSPEETIKLYFFDGDVTRMPEVVNPHDHRYDFDTWVVTGASENIWFEKSEVRGDVFNRFAYRTPLNDGTGFAFDGEERLMETRRLRRASGEHYFMRADELHTIRIVENETVLMLRQGVDVVPLDAATQTFTRGDAPALSGLYSRFTHDQVIARLKRLRERTGVDLLQGVV